MYWSGMVWVFHVEVSKKSPIRSGSKKRVKELVDDDVLKQPLMQPSSKENDLVVYTLNGLPKV